MASRPDVSIIVPCYNAADTVADTLASVRAQTHQNWEVICVDDESTDGTPTLLEAGAEADPRVRRLRVPHGGLAAARNRGVPLARADRVLFLDADDVLRPDALAILLTAARTVGDGTIVAAGYELLDRQARPLSTFRFPAVPRFSVGAFLRGNRITATTLVPVSILGARPFDETLPACEDWDLWLRLAAAGARCATVPRVLFGYRLREASLGHNADVMEAAGRRVLERWLPYAHDPQAAGDVRHRWACACGALALAGGQRDSIRRYFAALPPLEPTKDFCQAVASRIHWAFLFVRGASGMTWRGNPTGWLSEIEAWVRHGPLAAHAGPILECLMRLARDPRDDVNLTSDFVTRRPDAQRLVVYGLGTNGLTLLEHLRSGVCHSCELCVADDHADVLTFTMLGLARDDPRGWDTWPRGTVAVVTPNDYEAMRATLCRAGGRQGIDFIILANRVRAACPPADEVEMRT